MWVVVVVDIFADFTWVGKVLCRGSTGVASLFTCYKDWICCGQWWCLCGWEALCERPGIVSFA